jgi:hypothetical protein
MGVTPLMMRMKTVKFKRAGVIVGLMTLLSLMFTLMIPGLSHAAIFFDSDFELGVGDDWAANGWNDFGTANPGHLEITTERALTGTHSVKGTFDNINGSTQRPSIYRSWTRVPHIFARFASRASSGFQIGSNGHTKMMKFKDDAGYPQVWILNKYGAYTIEMEGPYEGPTVISLSSGIAPSQTSWDQIEFELQLNTPGQSNGLMRLWVNGVLRIEQLNKEYIGPTPTSVGANGLSNPSTYLIRTVQIYIQSGVGSIYYDRVAVGDTRIGPTRSTTASIDSTPPARPALNAIP